MGTARAGARRRAAPAWAAAAALAAALGAGPAPAQPGGAAGGGRPPLASEASGFEVGVARLRYGGGGDWYANPSSLPNWLAQFAARTGIPTPAEEAVVSLDSDDLYRHPLLYVTGHGRIALSDRELAELRRYLEAGGFLWVDDNYGLDRSFRELAAQLFPDAPLAPLGSGHPIFRAFYDLPGLPKIHEHDGEPAQAFGVDRGGRLLVLYTYSSDIGDGLEDPDVHGDPPAVREAAVQMAVNVLMYVLTRP